MAYDSLKALIRQYIKTNGEQEITGQILQNVLVEMVNQYPSTDGYATQSWVTSQGYATTSQLAGYLPLTGGTIKGSSNDYKVNILPNGISVQYSDVSSDTDTITEISSTGIYFKETEEEFIRIYKYSTQLRIQLEEGDYASLRAGSFIKSGGTAAQFLKADGSVDSNAYITASALSGYATQSWVTTQLGGYLPKQGSSFYFITDADMPETAANISTLNAAHRMTLYRNAILMPYQMNDANDGGFIRSRGTSESSAIMEIGMWDDAGAGETIQFNYYPTTSTVNPTYSISVPKKTGTIALTSDLASYNPTSNFKTINNQSIIGTGNINIEGGGGSLYDAEIEYLETTVDSVTRTQWIDTGIKGTNNTSVYIKGSFSDTTSNDELSIAANFWDSTPYGFSYNKGQNNIYTNVQSGYMIRSINLSTNTPHEIELRCTGTNATSYINGSQMSTKTISSFTTLDTIKTNINVANTKIYAIKIWENNVLVRDMIPVRVGNVGYMYDKVSKQLFGNAGTGGDFVLGQDTGPGGGLPYLPLTGGTITGNLTVNGNNGIIFGTDDDVYIKREYSRLLIINEAGNDIIIGDYDNRKFTSIVNDLQGGTTDSTYRSVTQKWLIRHDGDAYFKSVSQTSDLRRKTIMGDVPMNLYNVANAPLFKFTWNNETEYSGQHIGSAAQYWQTVLPELVSIGRDADMTLAMQYDVIALASAITVAKTVVNHEERIILLERENEALKKEIANLKSA